MKSTMLRFCIGVLLACCSALHLAAQEPDHTTLTGIVHDELGRPLDDVLVSWFKGNAWAHEDLAAAEVARTDAAGRFACEVEVGSPSWGEFEMRFLVFSRRGRATVVSPLFDGVGRRFTIRMATGATMLARVVDEAGEAVAGVRVRAELAGYGPFGAFTWPSTFARTDARGMARIHGALHAGIEVSVDEPEWSGVKSLPTALGEPVELVTRRLGRVRGRLVDRDGAPVAGSIALFDAGAGLFSGRVSATTVDGEGRFDLGLQSEGEFTLRAFRSTREPIPLAEPRWYHGPEEGLELVAASDDPDELDRELDRELGGGGGSGKGATFVVTDAASGEPVQGAQVLWSYGEPDYLLGMYGAGYQQAENDRVTDATGRLFLRRPSNEFEANSSALVIAPGRATLRLDAVEVDAEQIVEVAAKLVEEPAFAGRVVDAASGEPVAGARVRALPQTEEYFVEPGDENCPWSAVSAADGSFSIHGAFAGTWSLQVQAEGRVDPDPVEVEVGGEEGASLTVEVARGSELIGRVEGHEELPAGCLVQVGDNESHMFLMGGEQALPPNAVPLGADGTFRIHGLRAGPTDVRLLLPALGIGPRPAPIPLGSVAVEGERLEQTFDGRPARPGEVRGRVAVRGLEVPAGRLALVASEVDDGDPFDTWSPFSEPAGTLAVLDRTGSFSVRLAPGRWRLAVTDLLARSEAVLIDEIELQPGEVEEVAAEVALGAVRVRLVRKGAVRGAFLHTVATAAESDEEDRFGMPGFRVLAEALGLQGRDDTFMLYLPCEDHELRLYTDRSLRSDDELPTALLDGSVGPDLVRKLVPKAGETVEVVFELEDPK